MRRPSTLDRNVVEGETLNLTDQLTLSQPGGADYAHHITTSTPRFSDLPTALVLDFNFWEF